MSFWLSRDCNKGVALLFLKPWSRIRPSMNNFTWDILLARESSLPSVFHPETDGSRDWAVEPRCQRAMQAPGCCSVAESRTLTCDQRLRCWAKSYFDPHEQPLCLYLGSSPHCFLIRSFVWLLNWANCSHWHHLAPPNQNWPGSSDADSQSWLQGRGWNMWDAKYLHILILEYPLYLRCTKGCCKNDFNLHFESILLAVNADSDLC